MAALTACLLEFLNKRKFCLVYTYRTLAKLPRIVLLIRKLRSLSKRSANYSEICQHCFDMYLDLTGINGI